MLGESFPLFSTRVMSSLTCDVHSETTKDRFLNMYHLPDTSAHTHSIGKSKSKSKSRSHSNSMTLSVSQTQSLALSQTTSPTDMTSVVVAVSRGKTQTRAKDRTLFNATVLELVRLIQAALAISGMFPMPAVGGLGGGVEMDGLLCDVTVVGIEKWVGEVGESCLGVEVREPDRKEANDCNFLLQPRSRWRESQTRESFQHC